MKAIYPFTFLYAINLSISFLLSALPRTTYFLFLLILFSICKLISITSLNQVYSKIRRQLCSGAVPLFLCPLIVYICDMAISFLAKGSIKIRPVGAIFFLVSIPLFLFLYNQEKKNYFLKVYSIYSLALSILGIWSFLLINVFFVEVQDWTFSLFEFTRGTFNKDLIFRDLYSFPYFTGAVLTGGAPFSLFGLNFHRPASYTTEPLYSAMFCVPAIFLIAKEKLVFNTYFARGISILVLVLFLFASVSVSGVLAFFLACIFCSVISIYSRNPKMIYALSSLVLAFFLIIISIFILNEYFDFSGGNFSLLAKFKFSSEPIHQFINFYLRPIVNICSLVFRKSIFSWELFIKILYDLAMIAQLLSILIYSIYSILRRKNWVSGGIGLFYFFIALRGSILETIYWPFHFFILTLIVWQDFENETAKVCNHSQCP